VTGHTEDKYQEIAIESGMDEVIAKPATNDKIRLALFKVYQYLQEQPRFPHVAESIDHQLI